MTKEDRRKKRRIVYSGGWVTPYIMNPDQFPGESAPVGGEAGGGDAGSGGGAVSA